MELCLQVLPSGALAPATEEDAEKIKKLEQGSWVRCTVTRIRNYKFLKKWMALAKCAYGIWKEEGRAPEYRGEKVQPRFERFRKDLTIMAGFYDPEFNILGELRLAARSISYAKMTPEEFEELYSATIQAVLEKVINRPDLTPEKMRAWVEQVLHFD